MTAVIAQAATVVARRLTRGPINFLLAVKTTSGISAYGMPKDRNTWLSTSAREGLNPTAISAGTIVTAWQTNTGTWRCRNPAITTWPTRRDGHGAGPRLLTGLIAHPVGQLRTGREAQLGEDVLDVRIDRALGQEQPLGDLPVAESLRDERGDLLLPPGERFVLGAVRRVRDGRALTPRHRDRRGERERRAAPPGRLVPFVPQLLPCGVRGAAPDLGVRRPRRDRCVENLPQPVAGTGQHGGPVEVAGRRQAGREQVE